jgi:hypothetical protein
MSSAYYAVFHALVSEASDYFIGRMQRQTPVYGLVYRSIEHRSLLRLCEEIKKPKLQERYLKYEPAGGFGPDLIAVAAMVVDLQEKRHLADYDPRFRAEMSDAMVTVQTSRAALVRFKNVNRTQKRIFLSLLVFAPR